LVDHEEGDLMRAEERSLHALRDCRSAGLAGMAAQALSLLAGIECARHDFERGARLWGAACRLNSDKRSEAASAVEGLLETARRQFNPSRWMVFEAEGASMTFAEVVCYALRESHDDLAVRVFT
jgi:hypothetical protein